MKRPTVGIATDGAHSTKERLTRYPNMYFLSSKHRYINTTYVDY